ncbi:MAG: GLUG motif-containing protein [Dehalococcoidia bacterium]
MHCRRVKKKGCIKSRVSWVFFFIIFSLTIMLGPSTVAGAGPPVEIRDWHDLDAVRDNLGGSYVLANDLDANAAGYLELASKVANGGKGWQPIGIYEEDGTFDPFAGNFDGQGHEIRDLVINRPDEDGVGLFRAVVAGENGEGGVIKNVGVVDARVAGYQAVGMLVGLNSGNVSNSYCTGNVSADLYVGGLVGFNVGIVSNSYSSASVSGNWSVGGLVGYNYDSGATVSNCYASGNVTGDSLVGGLVGYNKNGTVANSYSDASVTGQMGVGGLVAGNDGGTVRNSYSSSNVTGDDNVGGLAGHNWNWGAVLGSCYASGSVTGNSSVGGLVGYNDYYGTVEQCYALSTVTGQNMTGGLVGYNRATVMDSYAAGKVTGNSSVGGLVGDNIATVKNSFWDREASGIEVSAGGTGKTNAEMKDISTFSDASAEGLDEPWDITAVAWGETDHAYAWNIVQNQSYPFLSGKQFILYNLTINKTIGGKIVAPGPGVHAYHAGEVVNLVVEADELYRFVNWTGDVATIADVTATNTTITMNGDYSIMAIFKKPTNWPLVALIIAAVIAGGFLLATHRPQRIPKPPRLRRR